MGKQTLAVIAPLPLAGGVGGGPDLRESRNLPVAPSPNPSRKREGNI